MLPPFFFWIPPKEILSSITSGIRITGWESLKWGFMFQLFLQVIFQTKIISRSRRKKKKKKGGNKTHNPIVNQGPLRSPLKSLLRSPVKLPVLHKCQSCPKRFNTLDHLQRHILTHSKTKPFKCPHCVLGEFYNWHWYTSIDIYWFIDAI